MRVLHTVDWHLGDRLGQIDRTLDPRVTVEHVGNNRRSQNRMRRRTGAHRQPPAATPVGVYSAQ